MTFKSLLVAALLGACVDAGTVVNPKRGFVAVGCDGDNCLDPTLLDHSGWYYTYRLSPRYGPKADPQSHKRFVPMAFCINKPKETMPADVNATHVLGFNEPNHPKQCNMSPETTAAKWKAHMDKFPNSRLLSPATAGDGTQFFRSFFKECARLYGKDWEDKGSIQVGIKRCRIHRLAVHRYTCTPANLMSYLEALYKEFKLPIWLTEFACGTGVERKPKELQGPFLTHVLPLLDSAKFVERYAWMAARDRAANRDLVAKEGTPALSKLGRDHYNDPGTSWGLGKSYTKVKAAYLKSLKAASASNKAMGEVSVNSGASVGSSTGMSPPPQAWSAALSDPSDPSAVDPDLDDGQDDGSELPVGWPPVVEGGAFPATLSDSALVPDEVEEAVQEATYGYFDTSDDGTALSVGLAVGLGGGLALCVLAYGVYLRKHLPPPEGAVAVAAGAGASARSNDAIYADPSAAPASSSPATGASAGPSVSPSEPDSGASASTAVTADAAGIALVA